MTDRELSSIVETSAGVLYLCATPIGNLEDITLRALRVLREADLIAAEDTRHTRKLLSHYGIKAVLTSYHEHNKQKKGEVLLGELKKGKKIALVTDAGLPGVSDPGEDIVNLALSRSIPVIPIPGPSAGITALVVSGLPTKHFVFEGFLPTKKRDRDGRLALLKTEKRTIILYESPHRLKKTLKDLIKVLGSERRLAIARELTKIHEEVLRGTAEELLIHFENISPRGELSLIVEGCQGSEVGGEGEGRDGDTVSPGHLEHIDYLVGLGVDKRVAIREIARKFEIQKRVVYKAVVERDKEKETP
ncbi:MAG TPA: 16S rRNA (cytidine(1402)-2'-O)-methyltransferase [Clostridia bacterium]|nr:16S rRNA (cytidine(1402)-2'-O)-methyltransferase [Clostridia bacterium]